jgi:DNA repair protein RadC
MDSPQKVFDFLKDKIGCATEERFVVLLLNNKNKLLYWHETSIGTVSEAVIHPREVFKIAVREIASGIVLAHNHPSGTLDASREDIVSTNRLKESGKILGIPVLDHVIISNEGFSSMKERGYI